MRHGSSYSKMGLGESPPTKMDESAERGTHCNVEMLLTPFLGFAASHINPKTCSPNLGLTWITNRRV
jgi:hypothetical protein